jgi:hypothetical protein
MADAAMRIAQAEAGSSHCASVRIPHHEGRSVAGSWVVFEVSACCPAYKLWHTAHVVCTALEVSVSLQVCLVQTAG